MKVEIAIMLVKYSKIIWKYSLLIGVGFEML